MSAQVASKERHLSPPQPRHRMLSRSSEARQRDDVKMSEHVAEPRERQRFPPQAQSIMYSVFAIEQSQGCVFFPQVSSAPIAFVVAPVASWLTSSFSTDVLPTELMTLITEDVLDELLVPVDVPGVS